MKKILVPTDFSANSKGGIRFAIRWASRQRLELIFIHILHVLRASQWSDSYFLKYREQEAKRCKIKFEKFVAAIYRNMNLHAGKYSLVIKNGNSADISILDYCRKNPGLDYICLSTRGAGRFDKILGTNSGNLISKSTVPVIAIPRSYRVVAVKSVLYTTDLRNFSAELKRVIDFALPLKATIESVYFSRRGENLDDKKFNESVCKLKYKYGLKINYIDNKGIHSLVEKIKKQIRIKKPSVVVMFTDQDRTFFQKLFYPSKAEELAFQAKVPLLVFNKS